MTKTGRLTLAEDYHILKEIRHKVIALQCYATGVKFLKCQNCYLYYPGEMNIIVKIYDIIIYNPEYMNYIIKMR